MDALSTFLDAGRVPVFGARAAVGEDPSSGLEFQYLKEQMRRRGRGAALQWEGVALVCREILRAQGKHLVAAVYLAIALTRLFRLEGLVGGATIMRDITCLYWDEMFPATEREHARSNAYSLWEDEIRAFMDGFAPDARDNGALGERLEADAAALQAFLGPRMVRPPFLGDVIVFARSLQLPLSVSVLPDKIQDEPRVVSETVLEPLPKKPRNALFKFAGLAGSFFGFGGRRAR